MNHIQEYIKLGESKDIEDKQKFIDTFVKCIYVCDDYYTIYLKTDQDDNEAITLENPNQNVDEILENRELPECSYSEPNGQPNLTQLNHPYKYGHQLSFLILLSTERVLLI